MDHTDVRDGLEAVAVGLLTPFDDHAVDHAALAENAGALASRGVETFLACANISEYHSLTHEERVAVTETSVDALPAAACVLAGVGGSTSAACELAAAFDSLGVDALMVMPPDHTYRHERGLLTYYRSIAEATATPIVPYVRGYHPSVEFLAALTELEGVVGVKYAIADPVTLSQAVAAGDDDVVWVDGLAEPYALAFYAQGAASFTAGVTNFEPRLGLALLEALEDGDFERARALQNLAIPYQRFRAEAGEGNTLADANSVPAVKYGLELAGLHGGPVRPPIVDLSDAEKRRAETLYEELQEGLDELL
ncbi:dihydrodipicolinate synthase family protein [Natronobiforma cellulositropha]|uniref:dihydrodipicolinate synthase family protein n=1 Tax=Natronobiforma cellulositropha TaxID=1679076 RepID=UPI0021D5D8A8|nr:dihydrodipicolinate synthase family protein [Natronobiforma cellulositropha]